MKKVISFVVAIALVLSMSVCAFAAEVPAADADYDAWVSYYTEVLTDATLTDDAKTTTIVDNMPASKALFYASLDKAVDDVVTDGVESDAVLNAVNDKLIAKYGWGLDEAEWEYEVEENLDINIDGFIGNPADGNVAPNVPNEESSTLEEDGDDDSDSAGSFLDTILGVLGGLGDILFGGGGETPEEPTDDNNDPWGGEEPTSGDNNGSQVPNQGDTSVVAVATVALVAGAALVLTRKKSEDAE